MCLVLCLTFRMCIRDSLKGFNLNVRKGEIVGLAGVDGNGQTELVEVLTGLRKAESGTVTMLGKDVFNKSPKETFENGISSICLLYTSWI